MSQIPREAFYNAEAELASLRARLERCEAALREVDNNCPRNVPGGWGEYFDNIREIVREAQEPPA